MASALVLLLASYLQFHPIAPDRRFLPDEAFFMTFARAAAVKGDWLLPGPLDKPPLSLYFSALSMTFIGNTVDAVGVLQLDVHIGEFAGMLPNALLAILLTALMTRLAWLLYGSDRAAALAGLLSLSSPYLLTFGASAFTDMSSLFFSTAALYFALTGGWARTGLLLGLALWSKQQAALIAPLFLLCLLAQAHRRSDWIRLTLALSILIGALLIWDFARPEASIYLQAAANNAPDQWLAPPSQWLARLVAWLEPCLWLLGPPLLTGALLLGAALMSLRRFGAALAPIPTIHIERALLIYIAGYLGLHTILRFQPYDRYLLLILPPLILMVAGRLARRSQALQVGLALLLVASGLWSLQGQGAIGGDRGASEGIDALAQHLSAKPVATVIYDPWLGWELSYYLGVWHDKRRAHFPTAEALAAGALALDEQGDRYFVAPIDRPHEDWLAALREAGFEARVDYARDRFIVYGLSAPSK